jgi:hypothetical protein
LKSELKILVLNGWVANLFLGIQKLDQSVYTPSLDHFIQKIDTFMYKMVKLSPFKTEQICPVFEFSGYQMVTAEKDHWNIGLVRYSDPHCITFENVIGFQMVKLFENLSADTPSAHL